MNSSEKTEPAGTPAIMVCKPPDVMSDDRVFLAWQRTHMANERTFLAWSRTSIALLAFGFVIERFEIFLDHLMRLSGGKIHFTHSRFIIYMSLCSFFLAGFVTLISGMRFLRTRRHINSGEAVFSIMPDMLVVASVIVIIIMAIALALPRLFEIAQ
jgi:putative membrane protein